MASRSKTVPVRLRSHILPAGLPMHGSGHVVYDRELQNMRQSRLEALVSCVYATRGFRVVLTAEGCGLGATVIALRDGDVWLVRVEAGPAGVESLDALVRMRAAYRRLADHPYRLALVVRTYCSRELERRVAALRVDITDGVHLIDEVEANPITYEQVLRAESRRCRSMLEAVERLQLLLAGHLAEEFE